MNMKKVMCVAVALVASSVAFGDATVNFHDNTGYGLTITMASYFPSRTTIGQQSISLPIMQGGPLADNASITGSILPPAVPTPPQTDAPQGSIGWTSTNNAPGVTAAVYNFTAFAGGKPWDVYTKQYCIRIVVDGSDLGTKCTNPNSDWDPAQWTTPGEFGDGSVVDIYFTPAPSTTQS